MVVNACCSVNATSGEHQCENERRVLLRCEGIVRELADPRIPGPDGVVWLATDRDAFLPLRLVYIQKKMKSCSSLGSGIGANNDFGKLNEQFREPAPV
jgi:hypothetical protein